MRTITLDVPPQEVNKSTETKIFYFVTGKKFNYAKKISKKSFFKAAHCKLSFGFGLERTQTNQPASQATLRVNY